MLGREKEVSEVSNNEFEFDFDRLIYPVGQNTFLSEYWQQRPLIISREQTDYYRKLFSMHDFDSVIQFSEPKFPEIQLSNKGKSTPWSYIKDGRSGSHCIIQLYNEYYNGNTIILRGLRDWWKPVSLLCRNLGYFFSHHVHANAYLTPKNSQGFRAHFDTHEVLIVQVEGSKVWRIYDTFQSLPLPLVKQVPERKQKIPQDKLGEPLHEFVLNAGDLLYIPSGYAHEASTSQSSSLHLSVGINTYRWIDLLSTALTEVSAKNVAFRKALPVGFLRRSETIASLKYQFEELLELLSSSASIDDASDRLIQRAIEDVPPLPDGHFTQIDNISGINLDTVVKKRRGIICRIVREEDSVSIQFPGNTITAPKHTELAFYFIADSEEFPVRDIPDCITDEGKLTLVHRLVREGLLTII